MRIIAVRGRSAPDGPSLVGVRTEGVAASETLRSPRALRRIQSETAQGSEARTRDLGLEKQTAESIQVSDAHGHVQVFATGTVLIQEGFDNTNWSGRGWYDNLNATVTTDPTVLAGRTGAVLVGHFGVGATDPWGGAMRHLFTATETLYLRFYVKYSSNWVGSGHTYHPHEFFILSSLDADYNAPADAYLNLNIEHNYQGGGIPRIAWQDSRNINTGANVFRMGGGTISGTDVVANTESRAVGGANGGVENGLFWENFAQSGQATGYFNDKQFNNPAGVAFTATAGPNYKNNWNLVEISLAMNSIVGGIGQHDGMVSYSLNGTQLMNRSDLLFRTGIHPTLAFHQLVIAPYIGDGSPVDQSLWLDDLLLATAVP